MCIGASTYARAYGSLPPAFGFAAGGRFGVPIGDSKGAAGRILSACVCYRGLAKRVGACGLARFVRRDETRKV